MKPDRIYKGIISHMILLVTICVFIASGSLADMKATTEKGEKVILKDDGTWEPVAPLKGTDAPKIMFADDAVSVWDVSLLFLPEDSDSERYSSMVTLAFHFKNNTNKKIVGVVVWGKVDSPLGKTLLENTWEEEIVLEPDERKKNDTYWIYKDNQFLDGQPFDLLWRVAQNGTAKISSRILKVAFEDGTIINARPVTARKNK